MNDINEFQGLIQFYEESKNVHVKADLEELILSTDISNFKEEAFTYLVENRLSRKLNFHTLTAHIIECVGFSYVLDTFLNN